VDTNDVPRCILVTLTEPLGTARIALRSGLPPLVVEEALRSMSRDGSVVRLPCGDWMVTA
jgi:hypothetical protein